MKTDGGNDRPNKKTNRLTLASIVTLVPVLSFLYTIYKDEIKSRPKQREVAPEEKTRLEQQSEFRQRCIRAVAESNDPDKARALLSELALVEYKIEPKIRQGLEYLSRRAVTSSENQDISGQVKSDTPSPGREQTKSEFIIRAFSPTSFESYVSSLERTTWKPNKVVIHESTNPSQSQLPKGWSEKSLRNLGTYLMSQRLKGGPHVFVDSNAIWVFNPLNAPGVHAPGENQTTLGLTLLGDFSKEQIPIAQWNLAIASTVTLCRKYGIAPTAQSIILHSESRSHKLGCPGVNFSKSRFLEEIESAWRH